MGLSQPDQSPNQQNPKQGQATHRHSMHSAGAGRLCIGAGGDGAWCMGKALRVVAPVQHMLPRSAVFATWRVFQHPAQSEPESIAAFGLHTSTRTGEKGTWRVQTKCVQHAGVSTACRTDANDMLYLRSSTHLLHKTPRSKGAMHFHTQNTIHTPPTVAGQTWSTQG